MGDDRVKSKFIRGHNVLKKSGPKKISKVKEMEKKKTEELETAAVLSEYIEEFQRGSVTGKTFVRAATIAPAASKAITYGIKKDDDELQQSSVLEESITPVVYKPKSRMQELAEEFKKSKEITEEYKSSKDKKKTGEKKKSNLELFKEELERGQKEREIRNKLKKGDMSGISEEMLNALPSTFFKPKVSDEEFSYQYDHTGAGSYDTGDPATTNLFISNINPKLNEEQLCRVFGTYGPLASVKIMWPRTEEEKARNRNCGFVAFMHRRDGEKCLEEIEGKYVMDFVMKIGWGKAVPIPPQPIYVHPSQSQALKPPKQSGLPFNSQIPYKIRKSGIPFDGNLESTVVKVVIPTERNILSLINRLVEFVVREGPMFEAMIMNREINNPMYRFLFENKSNEHVYYRWRVFSLLQGDTTSTWSEGCFRLFKGGSIWQPPRMSNYGPNGMVSGLTASAAIACASSANVHNVNNSLPVTNDDEPATLAMKKNFLLEHLLKENDDDTPTEKKSLSDRQRDRLEDMLRTVTTDRTKIGELMMWCIDHADYSQEIVECICESLSILETPIPTKIARLYVVNDILHNCSQKVPNVANFRKDFQDNLLETMEHLQKALASCSTKSQGEKFRKQVLSCLSAWQDWSLYPPNFLINLQNVFVGLATSQNIKIEEELANSESLIAKLEAEKELDGDPILDDIDGIPISKDEDEIDIDGEELIDEDIDGVPLSKDALDGIPLVVDDVPKSKWEKDDPLSKSRWERTDGGEENGTTEVKVEEKDSTKWQKVEGEEKDKNNVEEKVEAAETKEKSNPEETAKRKKPPTPPPEDEGRRKFLRDVEVKVMRFVDKLEQRGGSKSGLNIQKEAEKFRKQLIEEYDMVRAREQRRKLKSERNKRGRSNSPHVETKRQKSSKKREPSLSDSDSEPDIRQKIKSKVAGVVSSANSRSQSPPFPSPRRSAKSFSRSPPPSKRSPSPIFKDRDRLSRSPPYSGASPRVNRTRRSPTFTPSPRRSASPGRRSISPDLAVSPRYSKMARSPSPHSSPSSPKKLSSSIIKSAKKKKTKKSRR